MNNKCENVSQDLKFLYFIDSKTCFDKKDKHGIYVKEAVLKRVPIIKETRKSYYVPKNENCKTLEEFGKTVPDYSNCYLVNKEDMKAKISTIGDTHRTYYQHPFLARETYFMKQNAYKISQALKLSNNPFLLRQIAHNLEVEDLVELKYDLEGEN